jgi:hypothetical protein
VYRRGRKHILSAQSVLLVTPLYNNNLVSHGLFSVHTSQIKHALPAQPAKYTGSKLSSFSISLEKAKNQANKEGPSSLLFRRSFKIWILKLSKWASSRTIERERERMDEFATRFPPSWMDGSLTGAVNQDEVESFFTAFVSVLASLLLLIAELLSPTSLAGLFYTENTRSRAVCHIYTISILSHPSYTGRI